MQKLGHEPRLSKTQATLYMTQGEHETKEKKTWGKIHKCMKLINAPKCVTFESHDEIERAYHRVCI